ncbi:lipocalin Can f 6.0101-like [Orycteropus afer afer]|uniref:Lipocalin Can f 6.0101-like n=1 Tax=Orycteropus afer afer TaxID=1230840 RepID=A0A8B7B2Q7_ORYAF|nr:lipocalin Can f 6.0101-like [Orycteropus afer afer]
MHPGHFQIEGKWNSIKLGATNRAVIEEGGSYRCFMSAIELLKNGNLNVTYFHRKNGQCIKEFYIADKTAIPGRYEFEYEGKNYLTFVAVTSDFAVVDTENQSDRGQLVVVELYGRGLSVGDAGQKAYSQHSARRGIPEENIFDLSKLEHCKHIP